MIRGRGSIYGYSASMAVVDEAWGVAPEVVEDGLEPTMAERASSQIVLVSTAHRFATGLMQSPARQRDRAARRPARHADPRVVGAGQRRHRATAARGVPRPRTGPTGARSWSSPSTGARWTAPRPRTPSTPIPSPRFKSQWLNLWPPRVVTVDGRGEPLLPEGAWPALTEYSARARRASSSSASRTGSARARPPPPRAGCPTAACSRGARSTPRRSEAAAWLTGLAEAHEGSRLVVGASLEHDPDCASIPVEARELAGQTDTRVALPLLRELVAANRLAHDGGAELALQVEGARVVEARAGGLNPAPGPARTDLLRATAWALAVLARLPEPDEEPAIF